MATLLNAGRVSAHPQLAPRRGLQRHAETAQFTAESVTNGFLRYVFEPVIDSLAELADQALIEAEFFQSLSYFALAYGVDFDVQAMEDTSVYPHNVFLAFSKAEAALQTLDPNASLAIIEDDNHRSTIAIYKIYETGYSSYYLPLKPVYQAIRAGVRRPAMSLLCSLIAYLYQVADVSYFSDKSSYVYYQCEMMTESISEDEDENRLAEFEQIVARSRHEGAILLRYICWKGIHLAEFASRHQTFQPTDEWEESLHRISGRFLTLYQQHPARSYYQSYAQGLTHSDDDYSIDPDQRISFLWESGDWVYDNLLDSLDCDFNGGGYVEEPLVYQLFDQQIPRPSLKLDFDEAFYEGLDELSELLKILAHEQHNQPVQQILSPDAGSASVPSAE